MPVSTWFGGEDGSPSAFRVSPSTTMILVKDVQSSSTDGATDSTVIARISVMEELGEPSPMEMSTPPSTAGTTGATGATGPTGSPGAADAGPASSRAPTVQSRASSRTRAARRRRIPRRERVRGRRHDRRTVRSRSWCTKVPQPLRSKTEPASAPDDDRAASARRARRGRSRTSPSRTRPARLAEGEVDRLGVHLREQGHLLLGRPDDEHDVGDADDVDRARPAHALAGDDLDEAVALAEPALLGQPRGVEEHDAR